MNSELLKIVYSITAFQLFFFGWIALLLKPKRDYNYWLSAFLFLKFMILIMDLGLWVLHWIPFSKFAVISDSLINYALCPVFYIFVQKISQQKFKINYKLSIALIPFVIAIVIDSLNATVWSSSYKILIQIYVLNYHIQAIIYFILAGRCYRNFRSSMTEYFTRDMIYKLRWLKFVIISFIILWFLSAIEESVRIHVHSDLISIDASMEIIFLAMVNVLIFLGIRQSGNIDISAEKSNKYEFSSLTEQDKDSILNKLNYLMNSGKYFRTPNLTLKLLADKIGVQSKHLSQVINECLGLNFCEYINSLGIEDAKAQLIDPLNSKKTILEIIYESGFNSKSVFNTVFKELTGVTPTIYRNEKLGNIA